MGTRLRAEHCVAMVLVASVAGIYAGLPSEQRGLRTPAQIEDDAYEGWRLVVFEADWCGSCKLFRAKVAPEYVRSSHQERARLTYADFDRRAKVNFNITAVPTFVLLDSSGREVDRMIGYRDGASSLFRMVDRHRPRQL